MSRRVLIVEDERTLAKNIATYLRRFGYEVQTADDAAQAFARLARANFDAALVDYSLPGVDGLELIRRMRASHPRLKAIMITGHGSISIAVDAMKSGAADYLSKPVALSALVGVIETALGGAGARGSPSAPGEREPAGGAREAKAAAIGARDGCLAALLGESPPMLALKNAVRRLLAAETTLKDDDRPSVLITGETGTGKEVIARAIHGDGPLRGGPFVELNCAALPAALVESELFGYESGAFTDARTRKRGLVEAAEGGTLFLDEIGDVDPAVQSKLLKLIEEKTIRRLGGLREQRARVRIVAATNQDLERRVAEGRFRPDLFFRLRIVHLHVPPLRERGDDILRLAHAFLRTHAERYGRPRITLSPAAERAIVAHSWPGNVRELRNRIEQAVLMADCDALAPQHLALPDDSVAGPSEAAGRARLDLPGLLDRGAALEDVEKAMVLQALERTRWNVTRAAKLLGLSRDTLRYRIEKYRLRECGPD